jgi:hypothetical protein
MREQEKASYHEIGCCPNFNGLPWKQRNHSIRDPSDPSSWRPGKRQASLGVEGEGEALCRFLGQVEAVDFIRKRFRCISATGCSHPVHLV